MKEYIGLLLWQEEKTAVMDVVNDYINNHNNLSVVQTFNLYLSPNERCNFVREIYEGEDIPDDNPKIKSESHIDFVVIEDLSPKYENAITSSGKNVYLNINSYDLKKRVREFYHWMYLHSTDDLKQFYSIMNQIERFVPDFDCVDQIYKVSTTESVDLSSVNYFHINSESTRFNKTKIIDSPHYNFVKGYLQLSQDEFKSSASFKNYLNYTQRESAYHNQCAHSVDKFIKLIDDFDFKNYHLSDKDQLIKIKGVTWSSMKVNDLTPTDEVLTRKISKEGCCSQNFPEDKGFFYYDLFNSLLRLESRKVQMDLFDESNFISDEYFMLDGLHRASILAYHANKKYPVLLVPYHDHCLRSDIGTCKDKLIDFGYYIL